MKSADKTEIKLRITRHGLWRRWLAWGLLPLAVCLVLTLAVDAVEAADFSMKPRQLELNFQAIFAISAMLFLIAFTIDGHWTNQQRLARRIARLVERDGRRVKSDTLADYAPVVFNSVAGSSRALSVVGVAIAFSAVVAAAVGLGIYYALLILALAAEYQLFVLSRHPHYMEIMEAAAAGRLVLEADEDEKKGS